MINGIQHFGIGVKDIERSYNFYDKVLGFSVPFVKNTGSPSGMTTLLGREEMRKVVIALNPYGGALIEIFQYISREPVPVPEHIDFSYNGYLFYGLKVRNIQKALDRVKRFGGDVITQPMDFSPMKGYGWKTAAFRDPDGIYGILLEYPESTIGYGNGYPRIGGMEYIAVGVSDINKSIKFYSDILGYDDIVYTPDIYDESSPEWETLFGNGRKVRRALLKRSRPPEGQFKHYLRGGMIELIEVEGNRGRHNYEGRCWGDIGLMELCFDVDNIDATFEYLKKKGVPIVVPVHSQNIGQKSEASFFYIKDPDGSMLEFAKSGKLPAPMFLIRMIVNPVTFGIVNKLRRLFNTASRMY